MQSVALTFEAMFIAWEREIVSKVYGAVIELLALRWSVEGGGVR
jgi:hypothetical protein